MQRHSLAVSLHLLLRILCNEHARDKRNSLPMECIYVCVFIDITFNNIYIYILYIYIILYIYYIYILYILYIFIYINVMCIYNT